MDISFTSAHTLVPRPGQVIGHPVTPCAKEQWTLDYGSLDNRITGTLRLRYYFFSLFMYVIV